MTQEPVTLSSLRDFLGRWDSLVTTAQETFVEHLSEVGLKVETNDQLEIENLLRELATIPLDEDWKYSICHDLIRVKESSIEWGLLNLDSLPNNFGTLCVKAVSCMYRDERISKAAYEILLAKCSVPNELQRTCCIISRKINNIEELFSPSTQSSRLLTFTQLQLILSLYADEELGRATQDSMNKIVAKYPALNGILEEVLEAIPNNSDPNECDMIATVLGELEHSFWKGHRELPELLQKPEYLFHTHHRLRCWAFEQSLSLDCLTFEQLEVFAKDTDDLIRLKFAMFLKSFPEINETIACWIVDLLFDADFVVAHISLECIEYHKAFFKKHSKMIQAYVAERWAGATPFWTTVPKRVAKILGIK